MPLPSNENKTPESQRCQRARERNTEREKIKQCISEKAGEFMAMGLLALRDSLCDSWLRLPY